MASTQTVAQVINWAQANGLGRPVTAFVNNEPAITSANMILSTILSPPFNWNWNRSSVTFLTSTAVQDYIVSAATFGVIEKASYVPAAAITNVALTSNVATINAINAFVAGNKVIITGLSTTALNVSTKITAATPTAFTFTLVHADIVSAPDAGIAVSGATSEVTNVINVLGAGSEPGSPNTIAPQVDDNAGNITFRLLPIPDQTYQVTVIFQKKIPALITSLASTWAPIPDQYAYIYEWGFLALVCAYWQDPRWSAYNTKFVTSLLGVIEGLSEDQKNIFQQAWLSSITEQKTTGMKAQQGVQSRQT